MLKKLAFLMGLLLTVGTVALSGGCGMVADASGTKTTRTTMSVVGSDGSSSIR